MMKPKAALIKDGFLPATAPQRGRLSLAGIERCKELAAQGWQIEGYEVTASNSTAPAVVEKVKVQTGEKVIADIGNPARDESQWEAYANHNGKIVSIGMRTVDNNCGNSLTYCFCRSPQVWVDHETAVVVNFKPRPNN